MSTTINPLLPQPIYDPSSVHCPIGSRENMPLSPVSKPKEVVTADPVTKPILPETIDRPILLSPDLLQMSSETTNPPTLSELRFLDAMQTFRSFADKLLGNLGVRLQGFRLHLQEISTEHLDKLREAAHQAKSSAFWSILQKIASSLLSALSIVVGISLVATGAGTLVGGAMIGSGIFSLANMLMSETGVWDWVAKKLAHEDQERQEMLAMLLPCAVGTLAAVVGLFGAGTAFVSGINLLDKAVSIAQMTFSMFEATTTIGKGYSDAKTTWLQADLTEIKSDITIQQTKVDQTSRSVENVLEGLNTAHEKSAQFIKMAIQSNQNAVEVFG